MTASFFFVDEIEFPDESKSNVDPSLVEQAQRSGARRKYLAKGDGGFYSQVSWFPAGYTVPQHSHDHNEMLMALEGSLTVLDDGPTLKQFDSVIIEAGQSYGFTAGDGGLTLLTVRTGKASTDLK